MLVFAYMKVKYFACTVVYICMFFNVSRATENSLIPVNHVSEPTETLQWNLGTEPSQVGSGLPDLSTIASSSRLLVPSGELCRCLV